MAKPVQQLAERRVGGFPLYPYQLSCQLNTSLTSQLADSGCQLRKQLLRENEKIFLIIYRTELALRVRLEPK